MRILITGAGGFLGRHLAIHLRDNNELIMTGRRWTEGSEELDLCSDESVDRFIQNTQAGIIDGLIHTSSKMMSTGLSNEEQFDVLDSNIKITRNVVKIIQKLKINTLINCSSMAVYPNKDGVYNEQSVIKMSHNSDCMYGLSKFCSENIFDYMLKDNYRVVNLRLAQIYGEDMREDRIIPSMKRSVETDNCIVLFGNGERISSFIHVDDVCKVIEWLLARQDVSGTYNLGGENLSYLELAERLIKRYGDSTTQIITKETGLRAKFILDSGRIEELLNSSNIVLKKVLME